MEYILKYSLVFVLYIILSSALPNEHRRRHLSKSRHSISLNENLYSLNSVQQFSPETPTADEHHEQEHNIIDENLELTSTLHQDCLWLRCSAGRKCIINNEYEEVCVCMNETDCPLGIRSVCGSDGNTYINHCELHRAACVLSKKIFIDYDGEACLQNDINLNATKDSTNEIVSSKKKDLSKVFDSSDLQSFTKDKECTSEDYTELKDLLLVFHCNRLALANCGYQDNVQKRSVLASMFSYYDKNSDRLITKPELVYTQNADHLDKISQKCSLSDLLDYNLPKGNSGYMDANSFYNTFGAVLIEDTRETVSYINGGKVTSVISNGYEGVELTCSVNDVTGVKWKRNGFDLDTTFFEGFGTMLGNKLYISKVNLDHTGNYTCYSKEGTDHQILVVQVKPSVRTDDVSRVKEGMRTSLRCHADGVPEPRTTWKVAQYDLPTDSKRYEWTNENKTVEIVSPRTDLDSAEYDCLAISAAGWAVSKVNVTVTPEEPTIKAKPIRGQYIVFHGSGYTAVEEENCFTTHSVEFYAHDFMQHLNGASDIEDRLCPAMNSCRWGVQANINGKVIYATQPDQNRIIVIDAADGFRPKHVIILDHPANDLSYHQLNDQLWILTGNQPQFQKILVLERASQPGSYNIHPLSLTQTVFDMVEKLFTPPMNSFNRSNRYAFTKKFNEMGLNRIDTNSMTPQGQVDTSNWSCQPMMLHYLTIGGLAIIECESVNNESLNLLLDMMTNQVLMALEQGQVYVSPNTRLILFLKRPKDMAVYQLHDNATLQLMYRHTVYFPVRHIAFMDSKRSSGYDLAITSQDEDAILFLDTKTRKADLLEGLLSGRLEASFTKSAEALVSVSGEFGYHVMISSKGAIFIINKQHHHISCQWTDFTNPQLSTWVKM